MPLFGSGHVHDQEVSRETYDLYQGVSPQNQQQKQKRSDVGSLNECDQLIALEQCIAQSTSEHPCEFPTDIFYNNRKFLMDRGFNVNTYDCGDGIVNTVVTSTK